MFFMSVELNYFMKSFISDLLGILFNKMMSALEIKRQRRHFRWQRWRQQKQQQNVHSGPQRFAAQRHANKPRPVLRIFK